ncbi:HIT-like protein [Polychytrium aggregatum]|uniref:HIT-like protein n=1 Tax=Polychytrium aggregatum TaxID=110093 RepID=UPI0022FE0F43|nr:HIT-like protein [Polychytrium aggregatum]KAI9197282.1 HIT-like protein [Polychytrium aggregatum]
MRPSVLQGAVAAPASLSSLSPICLPIRATSAMSHLTANCIFCKIIQGAIPSHKILETELTYAFLDINPISTGHVLVIPKYHAQFFHQVPEAHLADLLPAAQRIVKALGPAQYNLLQNNGRLAHQAVDHVHFHIIPKTETEGLGIQWPMKSPTQEELAAIKAQIVSKLEESK